MLEVYNLEVYNLVLVQAKKTKRELLAKTSSAKTGILVWQSIFIHICEFPMEWKRSL